MLNRAWVVGWVMGGMLLSAQAHAQCTMDTECKGDRICEQGQCVDPAPLPPPPAPPAAGQPLPPPAAQPVAVPPPTTPAATIPPAVFTEPEPEPKYHRRTGMMVAGIVVTAAAPVVLVAGALWSASKYDDCRNAYGYNGLYPASASAGLANCRDEQETRGYLILGTSAIMVGIGVPLIVIGAKKVPDEPTPQAQLAPWFSPTAAGLALRGTL